MGRVLREQGLGYPAMDGEDIGPLNSDTLDFPSGAHRLLLIKGAAGAVANIVVTLSWQKDDNTPIPLTLACNVVHPIGIRRLWTTGTAAGVKAAGQIIAFF